MDASSYISEQIPLLKSLHAQLNLPPSALADDTARIDAAVRAAIVSVVRSREDEVAEWESQIADGKRALASLARAVGEAGRCVVYARRESEVDEVSYRWRRTDRSHCLNDMRDLCARLRSWRRCTMRG